MTTLEKRFGFVAALGVLAAIVFGIIAVFQSSKANSIAEDLATLQRRNSTFDVSYDRGSLIFRGDGAAYAEPEEIVVTPIFVLKDMRIAIGRAVPIAIDSGKANRKENVLSFGSIVNRVCSYTGNDVLCSESPPNQLQVKFQVNGISDSDDVSLQGSS